MARLGLLDLGLALVVLGTAWTRTPLGGMGVAAWDAVRGEPVEWPGLATWFQTGVPGPVVKISDPSTRAPKTEHLPEPWRTAVWLSVAGGGPRGETAEAALAGIDGLWKGDPEQALGDWVLGPELRSRAIARATAAGEATPERYASYRRFLPVTATADGDRFIADPLTVATVLDIEWPLRVPHRITSPYGMRVHPIRKVPRFHNGVDLGVPIGTPVVAPQDGVVDVVDEASSTSGKYLVLDHGNGVKTAYCHLSEMPLPKGTHVSKGEVFAYTGNTGPSTGPHLHFIVRVRGETVDPAALGSPPGPKT